MDARLPAHLEAAAILRLAQTHGGFATVLAKGERDAGTILIVMRKPCGSVALYERMPTADGQRPYLMARSADRDHSADFDQYLARRRELDPDIWMIEVEIADPERFIAELPQ